MTAAKALLWAREALESENYTVNDPHFYDRMKLRGMFWPDAQGVIESPSQVRTDGTDQFGRERWFFKGITTAKSEVEILIVFEDDGSGSVIFWTIYWN
jgi:hypothetical protein